MTENPTDKRSASIATVALLRPFALREPIVLQNVQIMEFSPDGAQLAVGTRDSDVVLIDPLTGEQLGTKDLAASAVRSLSFSDDGRYLNVGTGLSHVSPGFMEILDAKTLEAVVDRHTLKDEKVDRAFWVPNREAVVFYNHREALFWDWNTAPPVSLWNP